MSDAPQIVLLVDDEPPLLKMMSAYLTRRGRSVITFGSTDQAWEYAAGNGTSIAVAIIDLTMPGLSAQELAVRLLTGNPRIEVVVSSGFPYDLAALEQIGPGRVAFLHKPFSPEMLAEHVNKVLG